VRFRNVVVDWFDVVVRGEGGCDCGVVEDPFKVVRA